MKQHIKTRTIVLHHLKYSDNSLIINCFTRNLGRQNFIVRIGNRKKSKLSINLFQPLTMLDIEMMHSDKRTLQTINEAKISYSYNSIPFDPVKRAIAFFLAEVLSLSLRGENKDEKLYEFLERNLKWFDINNSGIVNFHLFIMMHLTKYIGFFPQNNFSSSKEHFSLELGQFIEIQQNDKTELSKAHSLDFKSLIESSLSGQTKILISSQHRKALLSHLIDFYRIHVDGFNDLKSLDVLQSIFDV